MTSKAARKYWEQYSEPEAKLLLDNLPPSLTWQAALTVPLCAEDALIDSFWQQLQRIAPPNTLVIMVLNQRQNADAAAFASDRRCWDYLRERTTHKTITADESIVLGQGGPVTLILIDRSLAPERRFPADQGVGLARKIAGDCAFGLWHRERLRSPWIHCSDADVLLPNGYFAATDHLPQPTPSAIVYPFAHIAAGDEARWHALQEYEIWLRYYALGLIAAGSFYRYPAIGSMITCHAESYAQARGFPKRMAGEDFYLLNKLAKLGPVYCPTSPVCQIIDRPSDRVPFGTGVGTAKVQADYAEHGHYAMYDPRCFTVLKIFLHSVDMLWDIPNAENFKDYWQQHLASIPDQQKLISYLQEYPLHEVIQAAKQRGGKNPPRQREEFHHWFDAFRTLRFIHDVRDLCLPQIPWQEAIARADFLKTSSVLTREDALAALRRLEFSQNPA